MSNKSKITLLLFAETTDSVPLDQGNSKMPLNKATPEMLFQDIMATWKRKGDDRSLNCFVMAADDMQEIKVHGDASSKVVGSKDT